MNSLVAPLHPLPIAAHLRAGDTVDSYIQRMARANHLRPSYLRRLPLINPHALYGGSVDLDRLGAVANRDPDTLRRVLQPPQGRTVPVGSVQLRASRRLRRQLIGPSCSPRSASSPTAKSSRSDPWPSGSECIDAPCVKP
jgi:hypothetical protein